MTTTPPKLPPFFLLAGYVCRRCGGPGCAFCRHSEHASQRLTPYNGYRATVFVPWAVVFEYARRAGHRITPPAEPDPWALLLEAREEIPCSCYVKAAEGCAGCRLLARIDAALKQNRG